MPTKTKNKRRVKKRQPAPEVMVRTSERSSFKTCRHQWQWAYIDQIRPRLDGPALRFGSLIHKALELYYKPGIRRGPKPAATFAKEYDKQLESAIDEFGFRDEDGEWESARDLGIDIMEHYVEHFGRDDEWEVISSEQTFQVPVKDPETGLYLFTYVGTLDGVWKNRMSGAVSIIDHKTTDKDPMAAIRNPGYTGVLDQQASAYWTWGVDYLIEKKILKPRHVKELDGMLYNYIRKSKRDDRPQNKEGQYLNKDGSISKRQPAEWFHREPVYRQESERDRVRARAIEEFRDMAKLRAGSPEERYKAPHWMNCNTCGYKDLCELHERGDDWESFAETMFVTWNPYDAHEIEEEGKR